MNINDQPSLIGIQRLTPKKGNKDTRWDRRQHADYDSLEQNVYGGSMEEAYGARNGLYLSTEKIKNTHERLQC